MRVTLAGDSLACVLASAAADGVVGALAAFAPATNAPNTPVNDCAKRLRPGFIDPPFLPG
jgi:hypothetical protein